MLLSAKNGILSEDIAYDVMQKVEKEYYLSKHTFKITHSSTGYWMTYLPNKNSKEGRIKKRAKTKEELESIVADYWRSHMKITLGDLIPQWIEYKRQLGKKRNRFKQQTMDRYMTDYHRFFDNTDIIYQDVSSLTTIELEDFIIERIDAFDLTAKSYSGLRTILRGALNYYAKHNPLSFNPDLFFKSLDLRPYFADRVRKNQVFTNHEIQLIKRYIDVHHESVVSYGILFGFYTGMRVGEISALKWEDVFDGAVYVHRTEERFKEEDGSYVFQVRNTPKSHAGERDVILTPQAKEIINNVRRLNPDGEYVFMHDGNRIKGDMYTNKLLRICTAVGIEPRSMHKARKTYASNLFRSHVDEALIIDQMGHVNIDTTKNYYRWNTADDEETRNAIYQAIGY